MFYMEALYIPVLLTTQRMYNKLLFEEICLKGGKRESLPRQIVCLLSSARSFENIPIASRENVWYLIKIYKPRVIRKR